MNIYESLENLQVSEECFDEIMGIVEELLNESNPETIQKVANKRAYDAGFHSEKEFNRGIVTPEGKKAQEKFKKMKDLIKKRENRTGDWAVKHSELYDNSNKGWEDSKAIRKRVRDNYKPSFK